MEKNEATIFAMTVFPNLRGLVKQTWLFPLLTKGNNSSNICDLSTKYGFCTSSLYNVYAVVLFKYTPIGYYPFQPYNCFN